LLLPPVLGWGRVHLYALCVSRCPLICKFLYLKGFVEVTNELP